MSQVGLGAVTAPSGILVLAMGGWVSEWPKLGQPLSVRARAAAAAGGRHVQDWLCELVAVPASAAGPLAVRATTSPSPFDGAPTIAVLDVELGLPWAGGDDEAPIVLGDLPVDRCGMVLGDAVALDSWVGFGRPTTDGLADVRYHGRDAEAVRRRFGGSPIGRHGHRKRGWLDLPVSEAEELVDAINAWKDEHGQAVVAAVDQHNDSYRVERGSWAHPLWAGGVEVAGCSVLGIGWEGGDHSMRHRGERRDGQVYLVTLQPDSRGLTRLRWTIPPYAYEDGLTG